MTMSTMELPKSILALTRSDIPVYVVCVLLVYTVYGAIYRLFLSPLAKVPGPRLAALTEWYEFYYEVIKRGRYTWKIAELHEKYGIRADLSIRYLIRQWLMGAFLCGPYRTDQPMGSPH